MTVRRDLQREFADSYVRSSTNGLVPTTQKATTLAHDTQTIVVDTINLTDGTQGLAETWTLAATSLSPQDTAYRATAHSTRALMRGLHNACKDSAPIALVPAEVGSEDVEWASWHHGANLELTIAGNVSSVLHYCDVTENEREAISLAARRLSVGNHIVFAAAHTLSKQAHLQAGTLTFDGLVSSVLHAYPGTHEAISQLREQGKRVVYMTAEPEDIATHVGHACGIVDRPSPARHADFVSSASHAIYANVNRRTARHIMDTLPQPVLIARHQLDTLYRMFDACH